MYKSARFACYCQGTTVAYICMLSFEDKGDFIQLVSDFHVLYQLVASAVGTELIIQVQ